MIEWLWLWRKPLSCALDPYFHLPAEDLHLDAPYTRQTNVSRLESFSPAQIAPLL